MNTPSKRILRRILLSLSGAIVILIVFKVIWFAVRDALPPVSIEALSPKGATGHREWSKIGIHYPGYPVPAGDREWSHWEIAQRHKSLVLKDLPDYVTDLRGSGAEKETEGTAAVWFFVFPQERLRDFEHYILELGVPPDALHVGKDVSIPNEFNDWTERSPGSFPPQLLFTRSIKAEGDIVIMNTKFGKAADSMTYSMLNVNNTRASIRIRVSWKSGNVQFLELPFRPDWDK